MSNHNVLAPGNVGRAAAAHGCTNGRRNERRSPTLGTTVVMGPAASRTQGVLW
ncbi:MAG: hypothetical protein KatS3mg111_1728 [Pirellulaceae bacterium]|nr:MAG: hypothetical protein KatS3mg111_1728 [Pirellulaceae bacterium]